MKIDLTSAAIEYIKGQLNKRATPNSRLRLGIRGSGCSGFQYIIEFEDNQPREKDLIFIFDGLEIVVDKKSIIYLDGSTLDYEKTLMNSGLKFINPLAISSCGCGESFSIKE